MWRLFSKQTFFQIDKGEFDKLLLFIFLRSSAIMNCWVYVYNLSNSMTKEKISTGGWNYNVPLVVLCACLWREFVLSYSVGINHCMFYPPMGVCESRTRRGPFEYLMFYRVGYSKGTWNADFRPWNENTKMFYCVGWVGGEMDGFPYFQVW